nr:DUF485 domain-containing protein [Streptacidiphilus sp. PB12-B1b]
MRHREPIETPPDGLPPTGGGPPPEAGVPGQGSPEGGFDWWTPPRAPQDRSPAAGAGAAPAAAVLLEPAPGAEAQAEAEAEAGTTTRPGPEPDAGPGPGPDPEPQDAAGARLAEERAAHAEVYRNVHQGEQFQEIRRTYRRFVFPACAVFLLWYLGYIVAAVALPGLMARPVAGPFNVAWLLGLLQFLSTFVITWLYARHARHRRDRAALGLRWETQDRLR